MAPTNGELRKTHTVDTVNISNWSAVCIQLVFSACIQVYCSLFQRLKDHLFAELILSYFIYSLLNL